MINRPAEIIAGPEARSHFCRWRVRIGMSASALSRTSSSFDVTNSRIRKELENQFARSHSGCVETKKLFVVQECPMLSPLFDVIVLLPPTLPRLTAMSMVHR